MSSHTRIHGLTLEEGSFHGHNREKLKYHLEVLPPFFALRGIGKPRKLSVILDCALPETRNL